MLTKSKCIAFFDVDETIWNTKSILSFYEFYLENLHKENFSTHWNNFNAYMKEKIQSGLSREELNSIFYEDCFKNIPIADLADKCSSWYQLNIQNPNFWNLSVLEKIRSHREKKHSIVLISGSFRELLFPLKDYLGVTDILCAPLEEKDGQYTGKMTGSPMIGYGKANAIAEYLKKNHVNPKDCFAYGDDISDIPFLGTVKNSFLVMQLNSKLEAIADAIGYQKLYI